MMHGPINRRDFLTLASAASLSAAGCATWARHEKQPTRPPNFVFILIDDLGYADVGCFGSTFHETPNIDRLAAGGERFTQAYAACPVCSPTRASIMTGKYPARLKLTDYLKGKRSPEDSPLSPAPYLDELPLEEITVAEALRTAGYATGHVGKWHLGKRGFWPEDQGFDFNFGGCYSGMPKSYFWPAWKGNPPIEGESEGQYLADRLTDEACRFIEANKDRPFYLNFCHYSVHVPIEAKPDKLAKYEEKLKQHPANPGEQNNPRYAAMVESVDDSVGRVMETLERCGIAENTVVVFFSDNGGLSVEEGAHTPATTNAPLRDGKGYLHEGGIREPMIVSWPAAIAAGSVCETPVCSIDFMPTVCALAGVDFRSAGARDVDGVDLSGLLRNPRATLRRDALYWHYPHFSNQGGRPGGAVRAGDWKLIENYEYGKLELYNLKDDIGEAKNLAEVEPARAAQLLEMLRAWRDRVDANMPTPNPKYVPPTR
ncbi:MAG: sulfatase [Candidatus Hydrogenedentes bacterium]|nr:sulfatase [Candidatus Hydrogenedentota bacterium]